MRSYFAFLAFLLYSAVLPFRPSGVAAVRVTALVDPDSLAGKQQKLAIEIAADDFNSSSSPFFVNFTFSLDKVETLIAEWRTDAVIAAGTWPEVADAAKIGGKANIPVLSLAASQPLTLAPKPYLFLLPPYSAADYARCLADLVKLYNWRRVIVIYEDDEYGGVAGSAIRLFSDALRAVGSEIDDHAAFPPLDSVADPKSVIHRDLDRIKRRMCKVFVVVRWSSPSLAGDLFESAKSLGLMTEGHVWIAGDDITTLLDSTFTPSFISSYLQGVVGIKAYFNETDELYGEFSSKFRRSSKFDPGMYALRAYDAVRLIASGNIRAGEFVGLSGPIRFGEDGGLVEGKGLPSFKLVNVVGRSYREIGVWSNRDGPGLEGLDRLVYWPGSPKRSAPGGWGRLRVGVPAGKGWTAFSKGEVEDLTGFCVELFGMATKQLEYKLNYEFVPFHGSYHDLLAGIPEGFDAAVGDMTIESKHLANTTFTKPFLPSNYLLVLPPIKPESALWIFLKPFTSTMWLLSGALFIYMGFVIWVLEHQTNPTFNGPYQSQIGTQLWFAFSTLVFAHGNVRSYLSKVVLIIWLFVVLILTSSYTASLASMLTIRKLESSKAGYDGHQISRKNSQEVHGYHEHIIQKIWTIEFFESSNITAAYLETPHLQLILSQNNGYTDHRETQKVGGFGFVFPKGSPLAADFSKAILELSEDGKLKQLENKWLSSSYTMWPASTKDTKTGGLSFDGFWGLFLVAGLTTTFVFLLFMARSVQSSLQSYYGLTLSKGGIPLKVQFPGSIYKGASTL